MNENVEEKKEDTRVLIVDDAEIMRNMLKVTLKRFGLDIVGEAGDGEEAVRKYFELKPDLVIMDLVMPKRDGVWAVRKIMKEDPKAKILILSSFSSSTNVIQCIKAGAKDFVTKPIKEEILRERIKKLLDVEPEKKPAGE